MKVGKRTAKLLREAAVAGFVAGNRFGPEPGSEMEYPTDAEIWIHALRVARNSSGNFPALRRIATQSPELAADNQRANAATLELLQALQARGNDTSTEE